MTSYICPVCGYFGYYTDRVGPCHFCENDKIIRISHDELVEDQEYLESLPQEEFQKYVVLEACDNPKNLDIVHALSECRRRKYVYGNPLFDEQEYKDRIVWEKARRLEAARERERAAKQIRCPKCGCTEFQMVPRKWSPLTGFLTNKVDRVCVKCKKKF